MLRRLSRLLIIALLLALVAFAVSRLMGGDDDDDFDDFEDLDSGFEFQETPVEIDVPVNAAPTPHEDRSAQSTQSTQATSSATSTVLLGDAPEDATDNTGNGAGHAEGRLIDINGIGPAYEARLHSIGIKSIHDLAHADADSIAAQIEVIGGASTIGEWITQARSQHTHNQ